MSTNADVNVKERDHCALKWEWVQLLWKSAYKFPKTLEMRLLYDTALLPLDIYPKDYISYFSNLNAHQQVNGYEKYGIYTPWDIT